MLTRLRSLVEVYGLTGLISITALVLISCAPAGKPSAQTNPYDGAKDAFKNGDLEKALDLTEKLATAAPPTEFTSRARMLRAVIYTGKLKCAKMLAEAYGKGAEKTKNPRFKTEYQRLENDSLQTAAAAALNVAETAHQLAPKGVIENELVLEASYPVTEGPQEVEQLTRAKEGSWLESDQQDAAALASLRKGINDALADAVSGDWAKARQALASGSVKLPGAATAIFLAQELADGAAVFDRHHARDPQKLLVLCDEGELTVKAAMAALKDAPNKDQEKQARQLQDKFANLRKDK